MKENTSAKTPLQASSRDVQGITVVVMLLRDESIVSRVVRG
jgi:hypothetical protein